MTSDGLSVNNTALYNLNCSLWLLPLNGHNNLLGKSVYSLHAMLGKITFSQIHKKNIKKKANVQAGREAQSTPEATSRSKYHLHVDIQNALQQDNIALFLMF